MPHGPLTPLNTPPPPHHPLNTGTCTAYKTLTALLPAITPTNPTAQARFYGASLRLAFHDAGEVDLSTTDAMGPDGCLNTVNTDNVGLLEPSSPVFSIIEPLWQTVCDQITRADFWALVAKTVVETADPTHTISIPYQYGRKDNLVCAVGAGRLPSAQGGAATISQVFVTQMGLTLNDAVTLIGAHTLGHVHTQVRPCLTRMYLCMYLCTYVSHPCFCLTLIASNAYLIPPIAHPQP